MHTIQINVSDNIYDSFLKTINQFEKSDLQVVSEEISKAIDFEIPDWQKEIVLERIKNEDVSDGISWEKARKLLKFKNA